MSEWHEERYHARQEALAEASHDCETEKEELEAENLALDDEIKELKITVQRQEEEIHVLENSRKEAENLLRNRNNFIVRQKDRIEDLREKLLERDEKIDRLEGQISHLTLKIERMITKAEGDK
jgi:predicted RNase H-like nuclease (RuvC/YqgF family)